MITSIFPDKDSVIGNRFYAQNTGQDSIVNLSKTVNTGSYNYISRILMKFDLATISASIVDGTITNPTYYLNMSVCDATEIAYDYTVYAHPISESWDMGLGKDDDNPQTTIGVSWKYRDGETLGTEWQTGSLASGVTSKSMANSAGGGNWYTSVAASQSFTYETADIRMDVTDIVDSWMSGTLENEGFILKYTSSLETDLTELGSVEFFSRDTHTKYPPKLEVAWDDSSFITGSLTAFTEDDDVLIYTRLKKEYNENNKSKIRVYGRDRYPVRTYATASTYSLTTKYLPSSSYYSIRDAHTEEVVVPFDDDNSKLSCDSSGQFFRFWMDALQPERFYRFVFKIDYGDTVDIIDNGFNFKLTR